MMTNLANILTLCRVGLVAPLCWLLWVGADYYALAVFLVAAASDFFDGYLARKNGTTSIGRVLDPLADKLLVVSVLVTLIGRGDESLLLPALLLIAREVAIGSWREWAAHKKAAVPSSPLAKWKTAAQMGALTLLIVGSPLGLWLLWAAVGLGLASGWRYLRSAQ